MKRESLLGYRVTISAWVVAEKGHQVKVNIDGVSFVWLSKMSVRVVDR